MIKIINILIIIFIIFFFYNIFKYYDSYKNKEFINNNRENINDIINDKIKQVPIFKDDTQNVIEFNSGFGQKEIKEKKNFWDLFKK